MELKHGDLTISSSAFEAGGSIPEKFSNERGDTSPPLTWSSVPDGTVGLVLLMHDPDAPLVDGFTHWVATGIDPDSNGLAEGASEGFVPGTNTAGEPAYMGPAPPPGHGVHHYYFHLFAIDTPIDGRALDRSQVLAAIDGHIIEQARLVGTYELS